MGLFKRASTLPAEVHETAAAACCRSLAPTTLSNYIRFVGQLEDVVGTPFYSWLPLSEEFLAQLAVQLLQ